MLNNHFKDLIIRGGLLAFLFLLACFSIHRLNPPVPLGMGAPPESFSAVRAREHLTHIARAPHPIGSDEHRAVREYIFAELKKAGLEPEIQEADLSTESETQSKGGKDVTMDLGKRLAPSGGKIFNVLARLKG